MKIDAARDNPSQFVSLRRFQSELNVVTSTLNNGTDAEALADLDIIEGLIDRFAEQAIAASSNLLLGLQTEINESIDSINQVDISEETLLLAKNQALAENALSGLAILSRQRSDVVTLIQQVAGVDPAPLRRWATRR